VENPTRGVEEKRERLEGFREPRKKIGKGKQGEVKVRLARPGSSR